MNVPDPNLPDAGPGSVPQLPFSAVVGQDEAKLALILTAVDWRVGGVLLRGEKGSAKSTLARGLAALLPGQAPFVELPVGATEDRVVGTLDLAGALTGGVKRFDPGLLAAADRGVLYVDEINLLPDHLVDVLLDVAASGINRVEREGISHTHPSRFLLIGSMNPEEGDLRPQLLDRFGLAVEVRGAIDPAERAAAVRRRLQFDANPSAVRAAVAADEAGLVERLGAATPAALPDALLDAVSALCASVGAHGLRADLTICRAAAALAGWEGRAEATPADVRRVAPLALAHRARRDPLDHSGIDQQRLDDALDEHLQDQRPTVPGASDPGGADSGGAHSGATGATDPGTPDAGGADAAPVDPGPAVAPAPPPSAGREPRLHSSSSPAAGRRSPAESRRGRLVGDRPPGELLDSVALGATVRHAAARRLADGSGAPGEPLVQAGDIRQAVRVQRTANLIVIAVDASGSMGAEQRINAAKGAVLGLLTDAYQRRDLVAMVAFRDDEAQVLLRPTSSVEVARARLAELPTGGRTPLAAGIHVALGVATAPGRRASHRPLLVLITDGRATAAPTGSNPVDAAVAAADAVRREGIAAVVIDVEGAATGVGTPRLGLARDLAARMGARHVPLSALTPSVIEETVREGSSAG